MIKILKTYKVPDLLRPVPQVGNYCYLIAGMEMLLSCDLFIQLIYFYQDLDKYPQYAKIEHENPRGPEDLCPSENISLLYSLTLKYIENNPPDYYQHIEDFVLRSLDITSRGNAEDLNVIFLCFCKSKLFSAIISFRYGYEYLNTQISIIAVECENVIQIVLNKLKIRGVYSVAANASGHYEIYQQTVLNGEISFYAKNTKYLVNQKANIVYIMFDTKCGTKYMIEQLQQLKL